MSEPVSDERVTEIRKHAQARVNAETVHEVRQYYCEIRDVCDELLARREADAWRTIESAPKDGTRIWVWLADEGFAVAVRWRSPPLEDDTEPCWWSTEMDCAVNDMHDPTHWRPLPAAPGAAT